MNNKLCTHPDGCQKEEPRRCLNGGCNETPDEIMTVVCEEIFSAVSGYFPGITIEQKQLIFAAMKRYAEREVAKKEAEILNLKMSIEGQHDQIIMYSMQCKDKDALSNELAVGLSEAIIHLKYLNNRFPAGSSPNIISRLETLIYKLIAGKEAKTK